MCLSVLVLHLSVWPKRTDGHEETVALGMELNHGLGTGKRGHRIQPSPQLPSHPICLPLPSLTYPKEYASHLKNTSESRKDPMSFKRG